MVLVVVLALAIVAVRQQLHHDWEIPLDTRIPSSVSRSWYLDVVHLANEDQDSVLTSHELSLFAATICASPTSDTLELVRMSSKREAWFLKYLKKGIQDQPTKKEMGGVVGDGDNNWVLDMHMLER